MAENDENGLAPIGAEGLKIKQRTADAKADVKTEQVDLGASPLGTDNEAGAPPDAGGMATARNAPQP